MWFIVGWQSVNFWGEVATKVEQNMLYTKMFVYVCSMWNWQAILQTRGANLAIQDGVQDGRRFMPIKAKTFSQAQKLYLLWLKKNFNWIFLLMCSTPDSHIKLLISMSSSRSFQGEKVKFWQKNMIFCQTFHIFLYFYFHVHIL